MHDMTEVSLNEDKLELAPVAIVYADVRHSYITRDGHILVFGQVRRAVCSRRR